MQCTNIKDTGYDKITNYRLFFENLHICRIVFYVLYLLLVVVYFTNYDQMQSFTEILTYLKHIVLVNSQRMPVINRPLYVVDLAQE